MEASIVVVSVVSSYPDITARSIQLLWTKIRTGGQLMVSCRVFTALLVLELGVVKAGNPENSELVRSNGSQKYHKVYKRVCRAISQELSNLLPPEKGLLQHNRNQMIDVYIYWPHQDSFKYLLSSWIRTKHSSIAGESMGSSVEKKEVRQRRVLGGKKTARNSNR